MSRNHYIQKVRCCPGSFAGGLRGFRRYFMGNIKVKQMSHYVKQRSGHRVLPSGRMCGSILASVFPVRSSDCARNTGWATTELNNGPAESRRMAFQVYLDWVKKKNQQVTIGKLVFCTLEVIKETEVESYSVWTQQGPSRVCGSQFSHLSREFLS